MNIMRCWKRIVSYYLVLGERIHSVLIDEACEAG